MATLQDLFNEIQADKRITNPDTFEEFQSRMEDPEYAERVNEILGRNGYDVNAYEGLKKKEESMVESAPLYQQESEQPSETTETTQTVGTEPVEEVVSEEPQAETEDNLDPLNADLSAYNMEVKTPSFSNQNTTIQTAPQQQDMTQGSVMNESVNAPKPANQYKNNDIISLAKNVKNKFISKHIEPIFAQAKQATAQFDQEIKPSEETLSEVEDGGPGDPKRKDIKGAATSLYNEMDDLNHRTALRVLGDTRVLGVKMDGDNYEVVFTNNKMGGGDQGRSYKGVVGDVTWEGYISNAVAKSDLYKDENAWEDLKSAVITQDTYSPELEGKKLTPSFNNNLAAHKSKYFPQGSVGQITGTVTIPKEKKGEDEASFGTDLKRFFEKVKVKVKTRDILNKDDEERKEYNIAEETIPKTEYVMDTEQTFYNSLNNTPETNAIMQANALNFSDILLPSSKNKETVMEGIKLFLAKAGYDENEINQKSGVIYKQMLRDARYHAAEQYIRHEIENGSKTYKFQDIDRLNQAKEKGVDELMGDESLVMQSDKNFVSNVWDISLSDYINHYDAKATVRGRNMDIKNIPGKVSAYTARMNELEAQIEAEKVKLQIPSKEQLSETVKGIKGTMDKVNAYDAQLSEIEQEMNSLLVDQDGQKYFKDENSKAKYEALVSESERILKERNVLVEQSKAGSQDIEKVNQFQNNISRQLKEYEALRKKLNYYDDDPDLLAMRGLSNTLTSIQNYESDKLAGVKNDLYDFQDYREKVRRDDETARKEAEDDNVLEAGGKGLMGGFTNALIGISKTGMYLGQVLTDEDSDQKEWTGGDELLAATSQLQENINQWASNPYYEKWGANWFFNAGAGAVPDLAAVYFTGGGAGFAELATTRGAIGALGKIAVSPTTVYFTIRSTGDYAEKLQKAGYSTGEAFLGGGIIAGTEAMLESLLPSFFNTTESISVKSFWKRTIEEGIAKKLAPEVIARQLKEGTIGIGRNFGKVITVNTFNEKIEEGTQTLFTESAFAATTDETIQIFDPKTGGMGKTLEAVTESAAIGGTIGLVGSSIKGVRTLISEKANNTTLKLTQLQIGRKYTEIISEADKLSKDFKGSEVEKEYEKIKKEYDKLSSNPNFVKYDDVAQSEVLDKSLTLNELKEAQKNYESQNIVDVKLNNQITEKEKELASIINVAQKNTDAREEMNKQLEEIGVQSFTLNANGELNGITFDEFTTQNEQADIIKKATDIIGKTYKPKPKENAVQKSSTGEVLQRESKETREAGSQRKGVEPVLEGEGVTKEGGKEEIVATPKEAKEQEAMQSDIDQVQQSTGTVINLNEDGTLTINAPTKGGQSKKDAAIENAKQELTNLGYNVGSRVVPTVQQEVVQEEVKPEITDEEFDNSIKEAEGMGIVAGTQSMNDLQTRTAQDPKKGKIVAQASRAVNALKSLFPNMNIVVHENDESYNKAMGTLGGTANTRGQFVYKPTADGNIQGAVHINLDRANARTIAHEVTHAALLKMFKGDGKVFGNFKDKLKDIAKNQKMVITDKEGNQVETTWGDEAEKLSSRYQTEDQAEEYLSELAGLVAEMDIENPTNKSILQKIAEFINKFILSNPQLNALGIKPITDTSSAEEVLEFFDTLGKKISRGETIDSSPFNELLESEPYSTSEAVEVDPDTFVAQPVQTKSQIGDYQVPNNIEILQTADLPINTLEEKIKEYNGRVIMITSDATGYGVDKNGDPILGGPGFASNATNVNDGIGFASVSVGTVKSTYTLAEKSYGEGKVLVLIMVQNPHTTINNSYGSKYIIRGLSEIRKSSESEFKKTIDSIKDFINNSTSLKKEINKINKSITDLNTSVKEESNKLKDLQKQRKEKLAEIQKNKGDQKLSNKLEGNLKTIDKKISTKNEKIATSKEQIKELSEKRSRGSIENLIKFFSSIKKDSDIDALVEEYLLDTTFNVRKILGQGLIVKNKDVKPNKNTTYSKIALNNVGYNIYEFLKEYGDSTILDEDMMLNDKGGFLVGGFELDVLPAEERLALINDTQSRGIKHPLFNAKLPGKKHFRLDALYPVNQNFVRFAKPDKAINLNKEEIDKVVKKFFPGKNEYSELSAAEKTKIKNEYFGPKGLLVDKTPDVATKVAKGEGFVPQEGASEKLQKAKFKTKPGVKTKAQLDDDIETVFKDNPELESIGTTKEYAEYLDNIFPESKLKDIFYRGSSDPNMIEAEDIDPKKGTGAKNLGIGIYWTLNKNKAADYTKGGAGRIMAAVLDIRKFHVTDINSITQRGYITPNDLTVSEVTNGADALISYKGLDRDNHVEFKTNGTGITHISEYVGPVDENGLPAYQKFNELTPEMDQLAVDSNAQVHILGSKKDVEGFKNFVAEKKTGVVAKSQIDIDAEDSPLYQRRTKEDVPFVSNEQVKNDVPKMDATTRQTEAKNIKIEPGMLVGSRININASRSLGYPVLTIHYTFDKGKSPKENPNASKGEAIGQRGNITLSNVNFNVSQSERNKIAEGRAKGVMAMAVGRVTDSEPNFDGVELSFNPAREHLFVDSEGRAVKSAEEVTVMGYKAYARGKISYFEDFEDPRSPQYTAPSQTKFAKTKEELVKMADDVETGNTTVEEVGVPELAPETVSEAINTFSDAIENGSTIEEATEEMEIVLANSAEQGPRKVTPPSEKTEPVSANKKEEKPKAEKKEKVEGPILSDSETIVAFTIAGNAKSIMDTTGVSQADAINEAVLEVTNGDQESADRYLKQPGVKESIEKKIKQIKAKTARELEAESPKITISERQLLLERVKAEIKAALEGRKEGKKEGVDQATEKAQKTIDALNKKLEEGKITKQELLDRVKELGYNIRFEAGVARLAGEKAGKSMGKKFGEFVGYFKGLKAGRTEQRGLGAMVSEYIKDVIDNEFGKKGTVSPATLKSIARRAATINNQKQLDAFVSYLDKVIANRRLAEGLNEIKKLQKKLLNKVGYQYTSNMKMFAKFDMFTADGDLAFDMLTMTEYLDALRDLTSERVPKIGKMLNLFDDMYDINQQNQPNDIDIADTIEKWQNSIDKLFVNPITINNFEEYKSFKREVGKYMRALNTLLETGTISEAQYESAKNQVIDASAVTDTYADQFQDQIDDLKNILIQGITDRSGYGLMDSIKDWLTNSPNTFTENQKKLIDQLMRAKPDNLMTLSLEDLDLLNQVVVQISEAGFVDEKNLRTLLDRAEIRGNEVGKSLVDQSKKVYNKYSNPKNGYIKMMRDTLGKSVVFWEARLGMKENGAFRKHLVDPIVRAINGWEKDSQRILKDYQRKVEKIRSVNIFKNPSDIKKLINRTKIERFKLTTDGKLVPDGTVKVSKNAYDRVMIGVVGHILDNAWNAKQKKKSVNDWLGKQMLSAEERNKMQNEDVNELDIVNNIYNDLKEMFPDGKGGLDHMAVLEAFESDPTSILTSNQLEYYNAARSALQEAGEYINSASGIRNQQHELNPYYMPRQAIGTGKAALTSTDIAYNKNVGAAIRSGASYQRVLKVPAEAIRYNIDRLVMTNVNEGLRDYYLTDAKRYVNEVFSNARENAKSDEVVMLNNLKQLSDTIAPFALQKSENTFGLSKLMGKFFVDALIGIPRTFIEFTTNLLSYAVGNRSSKSITLPFTPKEKQETDKLLSEFDSSVQFTGFEKKVKLSGKKGIDGYLDRESNFGLINKYLNNVTGFMRKGEWKSQFERAFKNNTGENFNYEKHFVKEKGKYYDDMNKSASDADFRMRRIMKGGNKAEQRQFIEWLPFVKKARISADSAAAPFVGMFSGFVNHDADNLIGGMRKAVTRGEIKDGLTQSLGAYGRLALYPVLMVIGKAIANLNLGDDDEKKDAQETLDSLKTPEGWADMALFSAKQVVATLFGGKYAAGGRVVGSLLLDAAYTLFDDRRQKRMIEDTSRELYFVDPIDFYDLPSDKEDLQLQIAANLEPIIGMAVNAVADFVNDVKNKGREQVTLYDIYEWTQQTEEGKQWMYMTTSLATLGQTLTVLFTPGAVPFIDDYVRWAEDELSEKKPNENTLYKTPGGEVIDMRDLFLDDSQRIPINISGISTRERDKISILATEKFNKSIEKEGKLLKGLFADEKFLYMEYLFDKAKYEAGVDLGFSNEKWSDKENEMVSTEPISPFEKDSNLPESEVTIQRLHNDILKGKQLSFVQNIKEKRKAEDYMFKEFDNNPTLENDYKNATIGGKLGVREYFKAKYLYDKYKLTEPPTSSNYFQKGKDGKIKQVESMPQEEN